MSTVLKVERFFLYQKMHIEGFYQASILFFKLRKKDNRGKDFFPFQFFHENFWVLNRETFKRPIVKK